MLERAGPRSPGSWPRGGPTEPSASPYPDPGHFRLFEEVTGILRRAAGDHGLLVLLDDIQWADSASLELLEFLASHMVDVPVLVACSLRELDVGRNDQLVHVLATMTRRGGTRRLWMHGLTEQETAELLERAAAGSVPATTVATIYRRAEGNPFYTAELAQLITEGDGTASRSGGGGCNAGRRS